MCNAGDRQGLIDCFTPEGVHCLPPGLPGAPWRGAAAIADGWVWSVRTMESRWTIEKALCASGGREAGIEWTHWKTGIGEALRGDEWYVFNADVTRIAKIRAYYATPVNKADKVNGLHGFDYEARGCHMAPPARSDPR